MAENNGNQLPHLLIRDGAIRNNYTNPKRGGGKTKIPTRDRITHANHLISLVQKIQQQEQTIITEQKAFDRDAYNGIYLTFESEPNFSPDFETLESAQKHIELCSIKQVDNHLEATVFVPEGKLTHFLEKIQQYRDENTPDKGNPKHQKLITNISAIKLAALHQLWTDPPNLFPTDNNPIWWEVWLRHSPNINHEQYLKDHADQLGLRLSKESIQFIDRTIILVYGSQQQLTNSIRLLGSIAEVRKAKDTADFFTSMERQEQNDWIQDTLQNITKAPENAPAVCILDTGVNEKHPLLEFAFKPEDLHTYEPVWGTDDRNGHGTEMAGLALYGDLTDTLAQNIPIIQSHTLESVKILSDNDNDKKLYGAITRESINRVAVNADRQRIYCMAVSATHDLDRGKPSSWSATIDALTSGYEDDNKHLIILAAGNTIPEQCHHFPNNNQSEEIHDPAQAWNALTVGGYTEKVAIDNNKYPGWTPLSPHGDLSPSSCTSTTWEKNWPIKPDIVMEAGNMAINPAYEQADYIDDGLQLLTTGHNFETGKQLVSFGDTSAASAQAARLAAMIQAEHTDYWPETIRALLVHSAKWTTAMKQRFSPLQKKSQYRQLLRYCGYGVPNSDDLFWSTRSAITLIAQETIQPFYKDGAVKTHHINIHELPWPEDILRDLPTDTKVELKITLSYFIEPNPGERGWGSKYNYASHGLRFDSKRPLESVTAFQQRINNQAREDVYNGSTNDSGNWLLGTNLRGQGSIHSDTWHGTAAELADRNHIAIYPVVGWWKQRPNLKRWNKQARYALIITIKTPDIETDIYTTVEALVAGTAVIVNT